MFMYNCVTKFYELKIEIEASCTHNDPPVGTPFFCLYQVLSKTPTEDSKLSSTRSTNQSCFISGKLPNLRFS